MIKIVATRVMNLGHSSSSDRSEWEEIFAEAQTRIPRHRNVCLLVIPDVTYSYIYSQIVCNRKGL